MKRKNSLIIILILIILIACLVIGLTDNSHEKLINDLKNYDLTEIKDYAKQHKLDLVIKEEYNHDIAKNKLISQDPLPNSKIVKNGKLTITISLGQNLTDAYIDNKVNELGNIPIMMYHHIVNITGPTKYIGGNVDKDGYSRTKEAFINDLEMYYQNGYRMISLKDYIDGNIITPLGKSPIVLTFDDGNKDNITVTGLDEKGNIIIDPNSAVGILETFKKKYPDFNVTATFFLNEGLFGQPSYNDKIMVWLINHGYDIGNHTKGHIDFKKADTNETQSNIAYMYQQFDKIIPNKYVHIIALPYGSPYTKDNFNFPYILDGTYNGYHYKTEATLRVGWEPDYSPFNEKFDRTFLKRVRAWDNNDTNFDIAMCFKALEKNRYISDGDKNTIVIHDDTNLNKNIKDKQIIIY